MKDNVLKLLLVLSLLLNISMLASAGYTHYRQSRYAAVPFGKVQGSVETVPNCLFEELSLKPEQQRIMQQKAFDFHADLLRKRQQIEEKRIFLVGLLRQENPDGKAIDAAITGINHLQEGVQKTVVAHLIEFKGMLDRDQQRKFLDMIETAMAKKGDFQCP